MALFVHGYPESSYMWHSALPALAGRGCTRSPPTFPASATRRRTHPAGGSTTWRRSSVSCGRWGSIRWRSSRTTGACCRSALGVRSPGRGCALAISDGGFFADRRWHDLANVMRTPGEGEKLVRGIHARGFVAAHARAVERDDDEALTEYWKGVRRRAPPPGPSRALPLGRLREARSPYEGRLAELGLPTLIVWGAQDRFAGPQMAERFQSEIPGSELRVFEQAGHFVWEDEPEQTTAALWTSWSVIPDGARVPLVMIAERRP